MEISHNGLLCFGVFNFTHILHGYFTYMAVTMMQGQ